MKSSPPSRPSAPRPAQFRQVFGERQPSDDVAILAIPRPATGRGTAPPGRKCKASLPATGEPETQPPNNADGRCRPAALPRLSERPRCTEERAKSSRRRCRSSSPRRPRSVRAGDWVVRESRASASRRSPRGLSGAAFSTLSESREAPVKSPFAQREGWQAGASW